MANAVSSFLSAPGVGDIFQATIGNTIAASFEPLGLSSKYTAWNQRPRQIPDPGALIRAYTRGFIAPNALQDYLRWNGILWIPVGQQAPELPDEVNLRERGALWNRVIDSMYEQPSIGMALDLWQRDHLNDDELRAMLRRAGADVTSWFQTKEAWFQTLDPGALIIARNREVINQVEFEQALKHGGYRLPRTRQVIDKMREALPPISDLVLFATRDLWDSDVVRRRRLFAEFPFDMRKWADAQGLFGETNINNPEIPGGRLAQWMDAYWGAHWKNIAPTQAYTMFHRIRESRLERFRSQGFNVETYTLERLRQELKVSDYALGDRDYLAAIAYTPMRLIDIRKALTYHHTVQTSPAIRDSITPELLGRLSLYNRDWAVEQFLDRGLHPDDAQTSADLALLQVQTAQATRIQKFEESLQLRLVRDTIDAYKTGTMSEADVRTALTNTNMSSDGINKAIATVNIEWHTSVVKAAVNGIRTDYFNGTLASAEVVQALRNAGMSDEMAKARLDLWIVQRNRTRRTATTQQLLKWLEEGLVTVPEVTQRLTNLGWSNPDQLTLLREAQQHITQLRGRTLAAAQRNRAQQAKLIAKVAKDAQSVHRQAVADLRAAMPRTSIQAWLRKALVGEAWARARLTEQQWPASSIDLWIKEALPVPPQQRTTANGQTTQTAGGGLPPAGT